MKKVRVLQILFSVLTLVAMVLLTGEIFGQMRPLFLKLFVISGWSAMLIWICCSLVLAVKKKQNKE